VDPDVDLHVPLDRMELVRHHASVLAAIASGGAVGAMTRQLVGETWSTSGSFPWSTFLINVSGSLLIGILIAVLGKLPAQHRLAAAVPGGRRPRRVHHLLHVCRPVT
jgi:Integral membrane protein possibly involved in chromosome condensation